MPLGRLPLSMLIASVLAGLGIVQTSFLLVQEVYRAAQWSRETVQARREVAQLQQDIAVLKSVQAHADDPAYLTELARCQGFVGGRDQVIVDQKARPSEAGNCDITPLP